MPGIYVVTSLGTILEFCLVLALVIAAVGFGIWFARKLRRWLP